MLHEYKGHMLKCLGQQPRAPQFFTDTPVHSTVCAPQIARYFAELQAEGLVFEREGKFYLTAAGRHQLDKPTTLAEPRVWCSLSTAGPYQPKPWNVRRGADAFLSIQSKGGC